MEYYLSFDIGTINMAYCLLDNMENIHQWGLFSIGTSTLESQCTRLAKQLDTLGFHELEDNLTVIIEKQPKINAKMRVIEGCILMYFVQKKLKGNKYLKKITVYSPKHKLKCYKMAPDEEPIVQKCKKGHYQRKRLGIEHCRRMITRHEHNKDWLEFFENNKAKADDLADSYLQGISYVRNEVK